MHIGISITPFGHHPAAWRKKSKEAIHFNQLAAQVKKAEEGGFDFAFFSDQLGQRPLSDLSPQAVPFEPTTLVAALATVARRIGLIATAATSQHEPYNLARRFASLDTISKGRAGWNVVVSPEASARDEEYLDVVSGLWDSWEDDAFVYDKASGRFFLPEKMHLLDHKGEHFTVRGPLNVNRSPQGKPVISHVLTPHTAEIAARSAELIFIDLTSTDEAKALVSDFMQRLKRHGRQRSDVKILANVIPFISTTRAGAQQLRDRLDALSSGGEKPAGLELIGAPAEIADALQNWSGVVDGFTVLPPLAPESTDAFIDHVVPELRERGLFRSSYEGSTLREHLGIQRPQHPASQAAGQS
ncbi:LLM class flavin-dependent oxidoreductase [Phyllobacterium sp. LjRoot231]|uniref:LLM class flavin-dependent oxidoreductase n=1 Tax=Phyllobacterium sp. LjRoot231 TaxID=3342289 RepID=UPI003ED07C82